MLDSKLLREDANAVAAQLARRGFELDVEKYHNLEQQRKRLQVETQDLQNQRNTRSKSIGQAKARGEDIQPLLDEVGSLGERLEASKSELHRVSDTLEDLLYGLPNILHPSVPDGLSEDDNQEIRRWGEVPQFDFAVKSHDDLGEALGQMDFAMAAKITGSRFVVMKGGLVRLHRALTQFMLDTHINQHGYQEIYVPYIVNKDSLVGTGQLPKFEDDLFKLRHHNHDFYLTSTGEVPITNTVRDQIVDETVLPIKYVSHTPCFRSEAGSYGKDTKGMIRQHQFEKVEMVWVTHPDKSYEALEQLTLDAEAILQKLNLAYRVVTLCSADVGSHAAKTYDIEVWLPSQDCYREISSCSNCEDFQARRMHARFRDESTHQTRLLHTLNGSGLAVGRTLVAIIENYQTAEGHIKVPEVLQPYMGGVDIIK